MESFREQFLANVDKLVADQQAVPYRVAVLGPGEDHQAYFKRRQIRDTLVDEKFAPFFPEELVDEDLPISAVEQERIMLRDVDVDFIVVLEHSEGPLSELAEYSNEEAIVLKTFVLIPESYYTPQESYPTGVIEQYNNRWRFTEEELNVCSVVHQCMTRARNLRILKGSKAEPQSF